MNTPASLRASGHAVGIRVEPEVYQRLQMTARRRKVTVTEYCRDVLTSHVQEGEEEATTEDVHRVAMKTLEDVQWLKHALLRAMTILLKEQYETTKLTESERRKALASMTEEECQKVDVDALTRGHVLVSLLSEAESAKRGKALARMAER